MDCWSLSQDRRDVLAEPAEQMGHRPTGTTANGGLQSELGQMFAQTTVRGGVAHIGDCLMLIRWQLLQSRIQQLEREAVLIGDVGNQYFHKISQPQDNNVAIEAGIDQATLANKKASKAFRVVRFTTCKRIKPRLSSADDCFV